MQSRSTFLGAVQDVSGTSVSVALANETLSGLTYVDGEGYRIGQVGSFVKIPIGYVDLFGIVTQVGASAVPSSRLEEQPHGNRWLKIQLIGEGQRNGRFERGISQYPTIGYEAHLVSERDLDRIYGQPDRPYFVRVGHIAGADSIGALVDINKLITRHSAVVGTTGAGKSTTVAGLLTSMSDIRKYPSARIIILDIHGEYGQTFRGKANIFKVNADASREEKELVVPFWALNFDELTQVSFGDFANEKDRSAVIERIMIAKSASVIAHPRTGTTPETIDVDTPVPFSITNLWYQLWGEVFHTFYPNGGKAPTQGDWAYEKDPDGDPLLGDAEKGIAPRFRTPKNVKEDPEKIQLSLSPLNIRNQLEALGSKLRIPRYDFLFRPGRLNPVADGGVEADLDELMTDWIGSPRPITILDLSGVPIEILNTIVGAVLRIIYDGLFWARRLSQGGRHRPLLIVMEEAHNYLHEKSEGIAPGVVQRIVKEGRKYGIGAMIVSQRPSEINPTVLSQCGTFFALRLANATDRSHISAALPDNLDGLTNMLPILRTGEAIIVGESVKLPMRTIIEAQERSRRPDSEDPIVYDERRIAESLQPGGWGIPMEKEPDYKEFVEVWRAQDPFPAQVLNEEQRELMERTEVASSTIAAIGYDIGSQTLEVEFLNGGLYQYFDVPEGIYTAFMAAPSKGSFLAETIKGIYRYARV